MVLLARRSWHTFVSVMGAFVLGYFVVHTVQGDRGLLTMLRLQNEISISQATLDQLHQEHQQLEHRVELMRPGSLDPDLLEERSRQVLDYSRPNEIVILTPTDKSENLLQRSK